MNYTIYHTVFKQQNKCCSNLLVILWHCENGSPKKPGLHTQMGMWLLTLQLALIPQRPGQGSWHFLFVQALSRGQSEFTTHSGLQFGGDPTMSAWHVHWHLSPITRGGFELGPQGLGSHGSSATTGKMVCGGLWQEVKGSPMYPAIQVHDPKWFITLHWALTPHSPGHGSTHFWFRHVLSEGHSGFVEHSVLHATYGSPKYSGMHWQAAALSQSQPSEVFVLFFKGCSFVEFKMKP